MTAERRAAVITRLVLPIALIALGILLLVGADGAPAWMLRLASLLGITAGDAYAVRAAAALLFAIGLGAILVARTSLVLARIGCALLFFGGLATLSALGAAGFASTQGVVALLAAIVGALCALLLAGASTTPRVGGPSDAWRVMALLGITGAAFALTAAAPVRITATSRERTALVVDGVRYIDLDLEGWEGRPIAGTSLAEHRPDLTATLARGRAWLVFYSPTCGSCHALFARHFSGALTERVVAIAIPPSPGAISAESDQEEIDCPECERTELPGGVGWLVTPPAVVLVEDGIVRCVQAARSGRVCLE